MSFSKELISKFQMLKVITLSVVVLLTVFWFNSEIKIAHRIKKARLLKQLRQSHNIY